MTDWLGRLLDVFRLQRKATDETAVELYDGKRITMERLSPREALEREKTAKLRESTAASNERAAEHMLGTVEKASRMAKVAKETERDLARLATEVDEALADREITRQTRPDRDEARRLEEKTRVHEARARERIAQAQEQAADHDANRIVDEARRRYEQSLPPDEKKVAAAQSQEEQAAADREWARHIVLDVAGWTYPINDEHGYRAYAATQYFGPRLDEGRTHEEALVIAVEQLCARLRQHGPISDPKTRGEVERRAAAMWRKWTDRAKARRDQEHKGNIAQTLADAARVQHEAAELLHQAVNGREPDEDFDATE